jgi:hypothetical protein
MPDSGSDSCDSYSPPLQLPLNCIASVSYCPVAFGPPWWPGYALLADGYGDISTSEMIIVTSVYDILGDGTDTDVSSNASDDFSGSFTATHDLFQFSYSYIYGIGADCSGSPPPVYSDIGVSGWLIVTDLTDSNILLDDTFINVSSGCYADVSNSGTGGRSVPVTIGHDIQVEFGIDGYSYASGAYATGYSDLTLQYDTAMRCIDPPVINGRTSEYYASLQNAYDDPATINGDVIKSQAVILTENLDLNRNISITLEGGYDCDYSAIIGNTTLIGNMTVRDGTVTIQNGTLEVK